MKQCRRLVERLTGVGYDVEKYGIPETVEIGKFGDKSIKAVQISVPVFDGAHEKDINDALDLAGIDRSAKTTLYDGRTGEPFDNKVTVGLTYMLKLHHLVDDKSMPAAPARTLLLPSSLSAARRSSAASVSAKWKFGRWKHTAQLTHCRKF